MDCPIFPFPSVIVFSKSSWLIQGSNMGKKGHDKVLLYFLECYLLPSSCVQNKFWCELKVRPLKAVNLPTPHLHTLTLHSL